MKKVLASCLLAILAISGALASGCPVTETADPDTMRINYPAKLAFAIPRNHAYHQTLTLKLFMSQAQYDGKLKRRDNGKSEVFLTCEQALEVIRKIDNLTLGIPKIVYLVGWQYNGHDSKYPAWFEGNERLKRKGDANAMVSLRWLMQEAKRYHTLVSLHINMFDAYDDSPLWDTYVKNNIIARSKDGSLRPCEWGWPVDYAQEWKTGFTQKRIDSLCKLLPIAEAGSIHIDAFHTWPPNPVFDSTGNYHVMLTRGPISPALVYTVEDETEAQRNIYRYWASKGIDVTSEGTDFLRATAFEGYQPMAWWFSGLDHYLSWPAWYYCGGMDNSDWGKLFGTSMHGEEIIKKDPDGLQGFSADFCLKTAVWYYLNRLDRQYLVQGADFKEIGFSGNVQTYLSKDKYSISCGKVLLLDNDDVFIPALWMDHPAILCYSRKGYHNRKWRLPEDWNTKHVKMYRITVEGNRFLGKAETKSGQISVTLDPDEELLLEKE